MWGVIQTNIILGQWKLWFIWRTCLCKPNQGHSKKASYAGVLTYSLPAPPTRPLTPTWYFAPSLLARSPFSASSSKTSWSRSSFWAYNLSVPNLGTQQASNACLRLIGTRTHIQFSDITPDIGLFTFTFSWNMAPVDRTNLRRLGKSCFL